MRAGSKKVVSQRDRIIAYKKTFGLPEGKIVLFDLMNSFHLLNEHGGDAFSEGQRSVVLSIIRKCKISLNEFDEMLSGNGESE